MKVFKNICFLFAFYLILAQNYVWAQSTKQVNDSLPLKLHHAEPLYIDLIRDLGAHKGEQEWNIGFGLRDKLKYDEYEFLVEYEWAPMHRLGLEVEVPVSIYSPNRLESTDNRPAHRVESLKTAAQYTFLVSGKRRISLAVGYINALELHDFDEISTSRVFQGNSYNPFLVGAKQLSSKWHALVYTGPVMHQQFKENHWNFQYHTNLNLHYMLPHSRNFVGLETNMVSERNSFEAVLRPQMRLSIMDNLLLGLVTGVPISKKNERLSTFMRLIYEPSHKHRQKS
ncbi:phosphoribosylformylglycinamidine synthase [Rufibacter tibetensis]|uniref:Phosphoribosylformylglycinamidine synthase n=2 Tax=Rufibacter tibetensis TaxID=512763 RepID=A0A0N7HXB8_9BACT|nr:phosphoribosylformylglycinamidine synthase [Rufibacter tibetensis]